MSTTVERTPASELTPSSPAHTGVQRALMVLETFIGVSAIGGGIYLMANPQTGMPIEFLAGTPFTSWVLPGAALVFFVGLLPLAAAASEFRRMPIAKWAHMGVGVGLLAWIAVEAAWIVVEPSLQVPILALGAAVTTLALVNLKKLHRWR